jgi:HPr kinase/phosphorylase
MDAHTLLHATTVDVNGNGLVILGASGRGKSALALNLMTMGATLVADDRTNIAISDGTVVASCPEAIQSGKNRRAIGCRS